METTMAKSTNIVYAKPGDLVVFSAGEYSDFGYSGSYVALKAITSIELNALRNELKSQEVTKDNGNGYKYVDYDTRAFGKFEPELVARGFLMNVQLNEIHLGGYGELGAF